MENNGIIKYQGGLIKRVDNAISVTNKLLALSETELIPYRKGDKWGFCTSDKKMVIECIYDKASIFSEGLAAIFMKEKGCFGYINSLGDMVIPFLFESANEFSEGLAAVKHNGKWGYVNKDGEIKIPFSFEIARRFSCGFAKITTNKNEYFIDKNGDLDLAIFDIMYRQRIMANLKSKDIIKVKLLSEENMYKALRIINDMHNQTVFASDFVKGKALIQIDDVPGIISINGDFTKLSPDARFDLITWIYFEGIISDGSNFFDKNGNILFNWDEYDTIGQFYEGLLDVSSSITGKWGFVNKNGEKIIQCIYDEVGHFFKGFAVVEFNEKSGFINKSGDEYWED